MTQPCSNEISSGGIEKERRYEKYHVRGLNLKKKREILHILKYDIEPSDSS